MNDLNHRMAARANRKTQDLIHARKLIGQTVTALLHNPYYFNDQICRDDAGSIQWQCAEHLTVSMHTLSDGESVGADLLPIDTPPTFEIEPGAICSWRIECLLTRLSATHLKNTVITDVRGMVDTKLGPSNHLVGFKTVFSTEDFIIFLNQGDQSVVLLNELPADLEGVVTRWLTTID
ncbi:hypothetical protein [Pseudomonas sp. TWP3-1]|uniref:hypothetical protein n=1 Tax=Pseudomonas sp. TWP3-1 TaxID=2804631 RepID=UPI003CEFABE9